MAKLSEQIDSLKKELSETGKCLGFYAREEDIGLIWEAVVKKCWNKLPLQHGDIVLDIGGHIGTFAKTALSAGVDKVISVEAQPDSVELLKRNNDANVEAINGFCVPSRNGDEVVDFKIWRKNPCLSSLYRKSGDVVKIPTVGLDFLIENYNPTVLKIDIEGGEYELLNPLPNLANIRALGVEFHPCGFNQEKYDGFRKLNTDWREAVDKIFDNLELAGFRMLKNKRPVMWAPYAQEICWSR